MRVLLDDYLPYRQVQSIMRFKAPAGDMYVEVNYPPRIKPQWGDICTVETIRFGSLASTFIFVPFTSFTFSVKSTVAKINNLLAFLNTLRYN